MQQTTSVRFRDGSPVEYQYGDDQEEDDGDDGYIAVEHRALLDDDPEGQAATSHPAARGAGGGAPRPSLRNYRTDSSGPSNALGGSGRIVADGNNNAASAANDGHGLATSLLQSIRHHARLIDGEGAMRARGQAGEGAGGGGGRGGGGGGPGALLPVPVPAYDPYADDDHVSLAPAVEMSYGPEAKAKAVAKKGPDAVTPALRDFVANAAAATGDGIDGDKKADGASGHGTTSDTHERQTERLKDFDTGARFNISNWFDGGDDEAAEARTVRLDGEAFAAAIARGDPAAIPTGPGGRAPKFLAPPPAMFRTATRHPSHLPPEYDDVEGRLDAPRRLLAARKRHRRNDSFLRLVLAVLCLGMSLAFAVMYGEGRFGMAVTTLAYDRKVVSRYGPDYVGRPSSSSSGGGGVAPYYHENEHGAGYPDYKSDERGMVYPDWWASQARIPDMAAKRVRFAPNLESHAAERDDGEWDGKARVETPFFWLVPRSGGNVIRTVMSRCLRLAEASELGRGSDEPVSFWSTQFLFVLVPLLILFDLC